MKITTKYLEEMLAEMNAEFDLDFKISGKHQWAPNSYSMKTL